MLSFVENIGETIPQGSWQMMAAPVPAGFPSPAADYAENRISLDAHLIEHKEATFFLRVEGDSMKGLGILNGDILVVDRSLNPVAGNVVIAVIDGEFTVKQLDSVNERPILRSANPAYKDIVIGHGQELVIWGVVRWAIHKVWPCE